MENHFCNMEHMTYTDPSSLIFILNEYARNIDNYMIVVLREEGNYED